MWTPFARWCTRLDVHPRACSDHFRYVRPVHVFVLGCTYFHVPLLAFFGMYALCRCVYASGGASTCLYRPFSVCTLCARVCTLLDVHPRGCNGPFRCIRPVHVCVRFFTCIHLPLPALLQCVRPVHVCVRVWPCIHVAVPSLFGVYAMCTCVHGSRRAFTCLCRPISVSSPFPRVCTRLDVHPRDCTCPFGCVRPLHVCVRV